MPSPLVMIPARMASSRLPGKPLASVAGVPMIVQVWRRACEAGLGRVVVAAAEAEIVSVIEAEGGEAVLTHPDHPSGSDRIFEALGKLDPGAHHDRIINLQGDLPNIRPEMIAVAAGLLDNKDVAVSTLVAEISNNEEKDNPHVVKAVVSFLPGQTCGRALYFTRARAPGGEGAFYHHIGLYGFQRAALERFVALPPSPLEKRERLEQLRALEHGMRIEAALVDTVPVGVDTPGDLEKIRRMMDPSPERKAP